MAEQQKGFSNEINKSLDELVNEDSNMSKGTRQGSGAGAHKRNNTDNNSSQGGYNQKSVSGGSNYQKRANKERDDDRGFRGGQENGYRGGHRDRGRFDERGGRGYTRGGFHHHTDEREVNNGDYQRSMEGRRLFVSNLAFETQWKYLKDHMRQAGDVVRADIFEDQKGRSRGIGVVEFRYKDAMTKALNTLNETILDGRKIFLKEDTKMHMLPPLMANRPYDNYQGNNYHRRGGSPEQRQRRPYRSRSRSRSGSPTNSQRGGYRGNYRRNLSEKDAPQESRSLTIQKRDETKPARDSSSERTFPCHISNLPYSVDREQLKEAFKEFGKVLHASVSLDERGLSRGFGVIEFSSKEAADNAAKTMDKASFNKREVSVRAQYAN